MRIDSRLMTNPLSANPIAKSYVANGSSKKYQRSGNENNVFHECSPKRNPPIELTRPPAYGPTTTPVRGSPCFVLCSARLACWSGMKVDSRNRDATHTASENRLPRCNQTLQWS